ncbi:MAG: lamin tail domain-containing protein [Candidatus Pacebacteria bacterium]|nr:lamin tail domain-containing protein [Candidatus Paceibacterota bacterium]
MIYRLTLIAIFLLSPVFAEAQVVISEIMYNLEGTDTGFEWIEICNDGEDTDLANWKLFEAETNHKISSYPKEGSLVLLGGKCAVIADNPDKFKQSNSNFSGVIFDSAFSLSNSGEEIILRDADLNDVDNVSYNPGMGANGDGNSLQLKNGSWIVSSPTIGTSNNSSYESSTQSSDNEETTNSQKISVSQELNLMEENILVDAGKDKKVVVGADTLFKAFAVGKQNVPLKNVRYIWSLGDGSVKEGESVLHTYQYPGDYVVFLNITAGEYSASDRLVVSALPANIIISKVDNIKGFIELFNQSSYELNLSWWHLESDGKRFDFPKDTIILPNKKLIISSKITNLSLNDLNKIFLLYPNGEIVDKYIENRIIQNISVNNSQQKNTGVTKSPKAVSQNLVASEKTDIKDETKNINNNLEKENLIGEKEKQNQMAFVGDTNRDFNKWIFLLISIMVLSSVGAIFSKKHDKGNEENTEEGELKAEDFKIIE